MCRDGCLQNWINRLQEGDIVEYDWEKAGKFKNITVIDPVDNSKGFNGSNSKNEQIVRMSCLKSASTIFSGLDAKPKKKAQLTIAAARCFEKYINETFSDKPSNNSENKNHQYQGIYDDLEL